MTSDNTTISSTNFNVDKDGNTTCSNINITGGDIKLEGQSAGDSKIEVNLQGNSFYSTRIFPQIVRCIHGSGTNITMSSILGFGILSINNNNDTTFLVVGDPTNPQIIMQTISGYIFYADKNGVQAPSFTQTSLESQKKNFEKLLNGLDIIKNTEIYKYNLKTENNGDKKHIGFVIGDNYKYSQEITSKENNGVDTYSMVSVAYKAIQEQQEQIEQLQKEIKELKGEK